MIVRGDAGACRALGTALERAATGTGTALADLDAARRSTTDWTGEAGDAWRDLASRQAASGRALGEALGAAGRALRRFADDLEAARRTAARATSLAQSAGLLIGPDGDVPPVVVPMGPYSAPEQAAAAAQERGRAEARADVVALVAAARDEEERAHAALTSALAGVAAGPAPTPAGSTVDRGPGLPAPGWNDWLDVANGLVLAPTTAADRALDIAQQRGADARALKALLPGASGAEAARLRREWRAGLRSMREARAVAAGLARTGQRFGPLASAARAGSWGPAVPVLGRVPVFNIALTGVGVQLDRQKGMSTERAVAKNVLSTGAGMAAGSAAAAGAGTVLVGFGAGAGVVAAAPVLVGIAAGAVVGFGVGYAVDRWGDDVADAAGDLWDAVF